MTNDKSEAMRDFMTVIRQSWTWAKMTGEEQARCCEVIQFCHDTSLIGTYSQRFAQLHSVYNAYLIGIGYTDGNWRENGEETPSF